MLGRDLPTPAGPDINFEARDLQSAPNEFSFRISRPIILQYILKLDN
jgi:hypothetical protein